MIAVGHENGYVSQFRLEEGALGIAPGFWPGIRGEAASLDSSKSSVKILPSSDRGVLVKVFEVKEIEGAGGSQPLVLAEDEVPGRSNS